jgi:hypothetical protein
MDIPYVKFNRSRETRELFMDNHAFVLLAVIAYRAKRTNDFSIKGLQIGECLLGDYKNYGMTEQQYRSSKSRLQKYGFATFRTTNKGTIATLSNTIIYDINADDNNETVNTQATDKQQAGNGQATTINNDKNVNNEKNAEEKKIFDCARQCYPDKKRGLDTEFNDFVKKHKDWKGVLPLLWPAIVKQIDWRASVPKGVFVPHWKNFKTWISQRCWEEEIPQAEVAAPRKTIAQLSMERIDREKAERLRNG